MVGSLVLLPDLLLPDDWENATPLDSHAAARIDPEIRIRLRFIRPPNSLLVLQRGKHYANHASALTRRITDKKTPRNVGGVKLEGF